MGNNTVYRVAGYVKLAKWWDRLRDKAIEYHNNYYRERFQNDPHMDLRGVYIDITGQKQIKRRPEMVRLINDCAFGQINCIATQTRAYLAANNEEFFYLIHMSTGGGWQDQVGGVTDGLKYITPFSISNYKNQFMEDSSFLCKCPITSSSMRKIAKAVC